MDILLQINSTHLITRPERDPGPNERDLSPGLLRLLVNRVCRDGLRIGSIQRQLFDKNIAATQCRTSIPGRTSD